LPRAASVLPAQSVPEIGEVLRREVSWVVVDWAGRQHLHWDALVFVVRQSTVWRPLAWMLYAFGRIGLGQPTYAVIGRHRHLLSRLTAALLRERANTYHLSGILQALLVGVILLTFLWNVREHFGRERFPDFPKPAVQLAYGLALDQRWSMFAPHPRRNEYWPLIEGRTRDGRLVDVFREQFQPPVPEAVASGMRLFPSYRWRKYVNRIGSYSENRRNYYFRLYAAYLCRDWNDRWQGSDGLDSLTIRLVKNRFLAIRNSKQTTEEIGVWRCEDL
jgi:hypothetical protein